MKKNEKKVIGMSELGPQKAPQPLYHEGDFLACVSRYQESKEKGMGYFTYELHDRDGKLYELTESTKLEYLRGYIQRLGMLTNAWSNGSPSYDEIVEIAEKNFFAVTVKYNNNGYLCIRPPYENLSDEIE